MDTARRSGRTTLMLERAHSEAAAGHAVFVVCPDADARRMVRGLYQKAFKDPDAKVKFVSVHPDAPEAPELRGVRGRVLYDHYWHELRAKVWRSPFLHGLWT